MSDPKPFLTARWQNLLLLNYAVDPALLKPDLPPGCELDLLNGKAYVSLVGFEFKDARLWGQRWPFFSNFPEINLRFYVKYQGKRAVTFVREFVPSRIIAGVARRFYHEPYSAVGMSRDFYRRDGQLRVGYAARDGKKNLRFVAIAEEKPHMPIEKTLEHFFKEHDLGVGKDKAGRTFTYRVSHARWRTYPVLEHALEMTPGLFGQKFDFLTSDKPALVVLAEGSEIQVFKGQIEG